MIWIAAIGLAVALLILGLFACASDDLGSGQMIDPEED